MVKIKIVAIIPKILDVLVVKNAKDFLFEKDIK